MLDGHEFKAYLPGGASGGILPASMGDIAARFRRRACEARRIRRLARHRHILEPRQCEGRGVNLLKFFRHESCGQCTPCREGTGKMVKLLESEGKLDEPAIRDLELVMRDSSICGLGQAAPNPVNHLLTLFPRGSLIWPSESLSPSTASR